MAQHIGIVACSAEGAALCYRTICTEAPPRLGPYGHPEVSLNGLSLGDYVACLERGDLEGVGALMLASARKLADLGADFLICPDNTIHAALPRIEVRSPRPWLHIADVVAEAAMARGHRRLALTGTRWLVEGPVYPARLAARGLELHRPAADACAEIDRIILEELVRGHCRPQSRAYLRQVALDLQATGAEALILGCTELPLIVEAEDAPLPILDSTRLLARAAIARALEEPA